jgi:hypothetical protein
MRDGDAITVAAPPGTAIATRPSEIALVAEHSKVLNT